MTESGKRERSVIAPTRRDFFDVLLDISISLDGVSEYLKGLKDIAEVHEQERRTKITLEYQEVINQLHHAEGDEPCNACEEALARMKMIHPWLTLEHGD